ncbi:efflux RND transporter permease subunit [Salinispira pacifica]|uniref:RND multidrug efflux transporter, Acriflavin resistance protein n=1 Tax=Salinispira pacifica TaxID=1307761 RepID=V5WD30_9SPIO|nr:efflux RND transporter permease subunit [Salinispira pacifica]AHC13474.1 RND multidrug efflux transporter, Acriflavin resistance protein [Salinispira pacifica]
MSIPRLAVKHPVTATMVFAAFFVLGILSLTRIGQELFPDVNLPTAIVFTTNPGVGPYEMESGVSRRIESAFAGLDGVESISSESYEGMSMVQVGFVSGTDLDIMLPEIREAINTVSQNFPQGTERPLIFKFSSNTLPSLRVNVFTGSSGINIRDLIESEVVPQLERIPGVAQVDFFGGREAAMMVRLDMESLIKLEIPIPQVIRAFEGENISLPGGTITADRRTIIIRTIGEFKDSTDIGNTLVGYKGQVPVYLKDIAEISLDYKPQQEYVYVRGNEGVNLAIQKQSGFNTVDVNEAVLERISEIRRVLPSSIRFEVQSDQAVQVRGSIGGVATTAWQGGILAIIVLLIFLRNVRSTVIVSMAIPVSVIATFSLIDFGGMTLNITSLLGITLAIGMFVDNAIVVLESIYRKQLMGISRHDAAIEGAEEVSKAIIASTLTTMAVFIPMLFVEGLAGHLFRDLSLTISFSLGMSLITALALIPMLSSRFLKVEKLTGLHPDKLHELSLADVTTRTGNRVLDKLGEWIQHGLKKLDEGYESLINWSLNHRWTVIISAVLLLVFSFGSILLLGMEFIPEADEGTFQISIETRVGSDYALTTEKVYGIEDIIREEAGDYLETLSTRVGDGGSNFANVDIALVGKDERSEDIWEITRRINRRIEREILDIQHNLTITGMSSLAGMASGGGGSPLVVRLLGDDLESMQDYAEILVNRMGAVEGTRNFRSSFSTGRPELQFRIKREQAVSLGLSPLEIAATVRAAYNGQTVSRFSRDGDDLDVVIILNEEDRNSLDKMTNLTFVNQAGTPIPLENVIEIVEEQGPQGIIRQDRTRVVEVLGNTDGSRALNRVVDDMEAILDDMGPAPLGISREIAGSASEMDESFQSLLFALIMALSLVYMVMASQFEDFLNPLIVMFSVPFSIFGLVAALLLTNTTFNILSFTGAILLTGIVVNNAIVLIDYIHLLRSQGLDLKSAIIRGGTTRLKPILMTTTTTLLGLIPMALGYGTGAELRAPMAKAVVGGLTTSTLITLVLIPTIYWIIESYRLKRREAEA